MWGEIGKKAGEREKYRWGEREKVNRET